MTSHPNIKEEKLAYYTSNGRARKGAHSSSILAPTTAIWEEACAEFGTTREDLAHRIAVCALQCWHPSMEPPDQVELLEAPEIDIDTRGRYL